MTHLLTHFGKYRTQLQELEDPRRQWILSRKLKTKGRTLNASLMPSRCGTEIDVESCSWHVCGNISENIEA